MVWHVFYLFSFLYFSDDVAVAGDFAFGVGLTGSGGGVGNVCGDVSIVTRLVGS